MIGVAFKKTPDDSEFAALRDEFLDIYEANLCQHTSFFEGIEETIAEHERRTIAWGIVTNKAMRFTDPLMTRLGLDVRAHCVVSGDTTPHTKPHPAPLLHAAQLLGLPPADCWYVGDDERDIIAAHAADMVSVAAAYGYLGGSDPQTWGAHLCITSPTELTTFLPATAI